MKICLVPLRTIPREPETNLANLQKVLVQASLHRPDLICLPECTLTGYLYEEADLECFSEPIPGPVVERMADLARHYRINMCFGLLERTLTGFFDTAVLLDRQGEILLAHRKIHESAPFSTGNDVLNAKTDIGQLAVLICGDLFHDEVISRLSACDLLLLPMARSFDDSPDPARWEREERQAYLDAVRTAGRTSCLVNALDVVPESPSFGGAMVVSADGRLLAESPHGTDQILIWNS